VLGEHSDEVLASIGYDEAQIASLREKGVIR
jgi:crotonobetainyl-CoA:carnitine CoA-transferase CaiB-like acyl-CoA transferase